MPKKLSPEEATVMIIRRRLQQMEEAKLAERENEGKQAAANDDDIGLDNTGSSGNGLSNNESQSTGSQDSASQSTAKELSKD